MTLKTTGHEGVPHEYQCHDCGCMFTSNYAGKVHRNRTGHYVTKRERAK